MPIEVSTMQSPAPASEPPASRSQSISFNLPQSNKVKIGDRIAFTEQLALLLETGTPLHAALLSLAKQMGNPRMREVVNEMAAEIETGQRFSVALAKHPELFSSTYVNIIAASEDSGFLFKALEHLQAEDEKRDELRKTIKSTLSYPVFLIGFSFLVVLFVLVAVFPKFADMFVKIRDQLPPTTIALMWCSDFLRSYWWQIMLTLCASAVAIVKWLKSTSGIKAVDRWKLKLPLLRDIFVQLYITQSFRVMSLSLNQGVSIVDALRATRDVVNNYLYRDLLLQVEQSVKEGGTVAAGFTESEFVPDLAKQMVSTAEASGNIEVVMARVSKHYERELNRRLDALSKMAEPVMLLVMGVVVGIIVSSLILPIFKLSKAVT